MSFWFLFIKNDFVDGIGDFGDYIDIELIEWLRDTRLPFFLSLSRFFVFFKQPCLKRKNSVDFSTEFFAIKIRTYFSPV